MKIFIECKSPLLQKSLELFLEKYLCSSKQSDIIIRDEECVGDERCFLISSSEKADLRKPFSKSQLILALENREQSTSKDTPLEIEEPLNFDILENRIDFLTKEYQQNIIKAVKAFYEK
ncbi:MAG: hypothetical protein ACI9TV_002882 [Sulfurimonas sp.]|uniref:hypothetical protein n=1 Tax=Sulfurimonas sp. TaxID=2022749 RepID=UPI0039E3A592